LHPIADPLRLDGCQAAFFGDPYDLILHLIEFTGICDDPGALVNDPRQFTVDQADGFSAAAECVSDAAMRMRMEVWAAMLRAKICPRDAGVPSILRLERITEAATVPLARTGEQLTYSHILAALVGKHEI